MLANLIICNHTTKIFISAVYSLFKPNHFKGIVVSPVYFVDDKIKDELKMTGYKVTVSARLHGRPL